MATVLTCHGIAWESVDPYYAWSFFATLRRADLAPYRAVQAIWPVARFGPLAILLMQTPLVRRRAESAIMAALARAGFVPERDAAGLVVVAHSLGTELTRGWLAATGWRIRHWLTCGTHAALLGLGPDALSPTLAARTAVRVAAAVGAQRPVPSVPWTNAYHDGDPWGAPLGRPDCQDVQLPSPTSAIRDHMNYWHDPAIAKLVTSWLT